MAIEVKRFKGYKSLLEAFPSEQDCIQHLETLRWNGNIVSPFDKSSKVYKCKGNRYKCKATNKYFNARTGTIFQDSNIPLRTWFMALYLISSHKKGISSHQLAKDLEITQKSAWFILHRIRYAFDHIDFKWTKLGGILEADEVYLGGKDKWKHTKKLGGFGQGSIGRNNIEKTPVLGVVERGGSLRMLKSPDAKLNQIQSFIKSNVKEGSRIITDEWYGYSLLKQSYQHDTIQHTKKVYVNGDIHTNHIESIWSVFVRRSVYGIYHQITRKHLQMYLDEFSFRYNTRKMTEEDRFNLLLSKTNGGSLKYKRLVTIGY